MTRSDLRSAPSAVSDELTKQHTEELRAQEERLVTKHREELEKVAEAATAKAREFAPAPASVPTAEDQKAAIDTAVTAALAAKDAELRTKDQTEIEKAVESGRLEGTMKLRLKETQLIRAQSKVKELELQIEEWKKAGVVPGESQHHPHLRHQQRLQQLPPRLPYHRPQRQGQPAEEGLHLQRANRPFPALLQANRCVVVGEARSGEEGVSVSVVLRRPVQAVEVARRLRARQVGSLSWALRRRGRVRRVRWPRRTRWRSA